MVARMVYCCISISVAREGTEGGYLLGAIAPKNPRLAEHQKPKDGRLFHTYF